MKVTRTPKQILERDRARKVIYRAALRDQGWRAHTVWIKEGNWPEVAEYLRARQFVPGDHASPAKCEAVENEAARSGSMVAPQHTQPDAGSVR